MGLSFTGAILSVQAASFDDLPLTAESCFEFEVFDPVLQSCIIECDTDAECEELQERLDALLLPIEEGGNGFKDGYRAEENLLVSYDVENTALTESFVFDADSEFLSYQVNTDLHQSLWANFLTLAPASFVNAHISQFELFTDGQDGDLAYVSQNPADANSWVIGIDIVDAIIDEKELTYSLIHELAHLLSLEKNQVPPSLPLFEAEFDSEISDDDYWAVFNAESGKCDQFFTGEGCANENSYINKFFFRFWTDIYAERLTFDPGDIEMEQAFYAKYQNRFVSLYAVTNPGEDFAESFTEFVLSPRTGATTIAEQKVNFFYDYPELVDLRQSIRLTLIDENALEEQAPDTEEETPAPAPTPKPSKSFEDIVRGRILLQVEAHGEAWYVDPTNLRRYFLGRPADAFRIMRALALGVTNKDLLKIKQNGTSGQNSAIDPAFAKSLAGRILLQVEGHGEAWYVHPETLERYYLGRPADAFKIMRNLGLGITNFHIEALIEGKTSL